jgi:hypothetical protein
MKCLHPECNNDLPSNAGPYCGFLCFIANNLPLEMSLEEAKAKVADEFQNVDDWSEYKNYHAN